MQKFNMFEIGDSHGSHELLAVRNVDHYVSWTDRKVKNYNLWAGLSTTDTDAAAIDTAETINNKSEQ